MLRTQTLRLVHRHATVVSQAPIADWIADRLVDLVVELPVERPDSGATGGRPQVEVVPTAQGWALRVDGRHVATLPTPEDAFDQLVGWCNAEAALSADVLGLHAAAAERHGRVLVMAAPSGLGKTVLVGGLVRRGWGYLSDELAPIAADLTVGVHPKPLTVKASGLALFPEATALPRGAQRRYVRPVELGGALGGSGSVGALAFVSYRPGAVQVRLIGPTAAALATAGQVHTPTTMDLAAVGALVNATTAATVGFDDLDEAAEALAELMDKPADQAKPPPSSVTHWPESSILRGGIDPGEVVAATGPGAATGVEGIRLADGALLHHRLSGRLVALDHLGATLWPLLDGHTPLGTLAEQLAVIYNAAPADVLGDLLALARQLAAEGMLGT